MAELTPIPSAQRPAEPGYQPLSGYAVAAIVVAGLFGIALLVLVGIGLWSRRTPLSYELLIVPIAGLILSIVARSHIRNAEGTRTGVKLANLSWWICVLGGAGFAAFLAANEVALRRESQRVADAFFEALKAGQEEEAFERYVLPPELRGRAVPGTPEYVQVYNSAGYREYANHNVIYALKQNGKDARVEHVNATDVGPEGEGFKAVHKYRITLPEGVFTVQLKMIASEPRGGGRPQWHIEIGRALGMTNPEWEFFSQYGRLVMQSQEEGEKFGRDWMAHLSAGRLGQADLYTRPLAERDKGEAELSLAANLKGAAILAVPIEASGHPQPTLDKWLRAGLFHKDASGSPLPEAKVAKLRELWSGAMVTPLATGRRQALGFPETGERTMLTLTPTEVTLAIPVDVTYGLGNRQYLPATIGVVCSDPALVSMLNTAKAQGAASKDDGSMTLRTLPARDWRFAWFRSDLETPTPPRPGGPDAPGGPGGMPGGP